VVHLYRVIARGLGSGAPVSSNGARVTPTAFGR
jgi:hypothetical protein